MNWKLNQILICVLLSFSLSSFAQNELNKTKEDLSERYNKMKETASNLTLVISDTTDYLNVSIEKNDKHEREFFFKHNFFIKDDVVDEFFPAECDSMVYKFYCAACIDVYFEGFKHKSWKWVEVEENYYVSKKKIMSSKTDEIKLIGRPQMWLKKSLENEIVGTVHFSVLQLTKPQWKEYFND